MPSFPAATGSGPTARSCRPPKGESSSTRGSTTCGAAIKQYRYGATTNQQWKLKAVDPSLGVEKAGVGRVTILVGWRAGMLDVSTDSRVDRVEVLDLAGHRRFESRLAFTGGRRIGVPGLEAGTYLVRLAGSEGITTKTLAVF